MDRKQVIENVSKYAQQIVKHIVVDKVVLFGSYAKNTYNENSDIDVAIIVNEVSDDFLQTSKLLNKLTRDIDYRIEPVLLGKNDDFSGFISTILSYGLVIYENKKYVVA